MVVTDPLYGDLQIDDHIVTALIETPAFQRLKRINQYGGVNFIYDNFQTTRYEHSIAVYHILRTIGAAYEVQIAGLLHDIGHTAFSHMVDMALESETENFHEIHSKKIPGMDEIEDILQANNIHITNVDDYPELKKPLPDVGADRVDYAVRDYYAGSGIDNGLAKRVLDAITLLDHDIRFTDVDVAREFAFSGLEAMWLIIYQPKTAVVYQSVIEMIKQGFTEKWLSVDDVLQDDEHVFNVFRQNAEKINPLYFNIFTKPFEAVEVTEHDEFDFFHVKKKVRYFDPPVIVDDIIKHLSEIDEDFNAEMNKQKERFEKRKEGAYFKINF